MNTAEVVKREVQRDGGFQVRQFARKGIRQPSQAAKLHSHREVLSLHKRCADMSGIGIALTNFGYNLRDPWWGVPLVPELPVIPVQFRQLSEVHVGSETFLDSLSVENIGICGELNAPCHPFVKVADKQLGVHAAALSNVEGGNQLAVSVQRDINPLVAKVGGIVFSNMLCFLRNERPNFVAFHAPAREVSHRRIHRTGATFSDSNENAHDRIAIEPRESPRAANRAAFKQALNRPRSRFRVGNHRVPRQSFMGFAERGIAGSAAPALNAALTEVPKSLAGLVLTSDARHGRSPLDFSAEKAHNEFGSGLWLTPRFGLAPQPVSAGNGADFRSDLLWWFDCEFQRQSDVNSHRGPFPKAPF